MNTELPLPFRFARDKEFVVPNGKVVRTGYVELKNIVLACKDRMSVGDVEVAYRRRLQLGSDQPWPCPYGCWQGDRFVVQDGRHDYVAALMLGYEMLLVAWLEGA